MVSKQNTPMQPYFMAGHQRPVRQVIHNFDGDLLFSCSDDGKVNMYDTYQCIRAGQFDVASACTSIDVTKNSKYVLATSVDGVIVFNVSDGTVAARINVPGNRKIQVKLSYGEKYFFLIFMDKQVTYINIYDFQQVINSGVVATNTPKPVKEIAPTNQTFFTCGVWGPLNKSLFMATRTGKVQAIDVSTGKMFKDTQVHTEEIYQLTMSHDFTMLLTASRDQTGLLLHPETFEKVRVFNFGAFCRSIAISPLHDSQEYQKFHVLMSGGQDARDVATTQDKAGGFEIRLHSIIFNEQLAEIHGHFGPVHSIEFSPDGFAFASGGEDGYVHYHRFPPEYFTNDFE